MTSPPCRPRSRRPALAPPCSRRSTRARARVRGGRRPGGFAACHPWKETTTDRNAPSLKPAAAHAAHSSTGRSVRPRICHVLAEAPDLAEAVAPEERAAAIEDCVAGVRDLPCGSWAGQREDMTPDGIGLLVLGGLLIRRVGGGSGFGAELLGQGDLLRPWQGEGAASSLARTTGWRVLEPARTG